MTEGHVKLIERRCVWDGLAWIWHGGPLEEVDGWCLFRRRFDVCEAPDEAWLAFSADQLARVEINGCVVHHGPPREVPPYSYYDVLDIGEALRIGKNEILIAVHWPGIVTHSHVPGTRGLIAQGRAGVHGFDTPGDWMAAPDSSHLRPSRRLTPWVGWGERVALPAAEPQWANPAVLGAHPLPERDRLLARDLPVLGGEVLHARPTAFEGVFDFGRMVSGHVRAHLRADRPTTVHITWSEQLHEGCVRPNCWTSALPERYGDTLELMEGEHRWESLDRRAGRFARVEPPDALVSLDVEEFQWEQPMERAAAVFDRAGDALGRRILEVSARTMQLCISDLLEDCPTRERAQYFDCWHWTGAFELLFGNLDPISRFLRQFLRGVTPDGLLQMKYPAARDSGVIPDFALGFSIQLADYLRRSGRVEEVMPLRLPALNSLRALERRANSAGLLTDVPGWIFLDNGAEILKHPTSAALNAVYLGALSAQTALARACADEGLALELGSRHAEIRAAWRRAFWRLEECRIMDADLSIEAERWQVVGHCLPTEGPYWHVGEGAAIRLRVRCDGTKLRFHGSAGIRVWIDGWPVIDGRHDEPTRSPLFHPVGEATFPGGMDWHELEIHSQRGGWEWEMYLSSDGEIECDGERWWAIGRWPEFAVAMEEPVASIPTRLVAHPIARRSQLTAGYACYHGCLDPDEARRVLLDVTPERLITPLLRRTTPYGVDVEHDVEELRERVVAANCPSSLFYLCHALRRYGLEGRAWREVRRACLPQLARGATTWWEEFRDASSLCHAWGAFVAEFVPIDGSPSSKASRAFPDIM